MLALSYATTSSVEAMKESIKDPKVFQNPGTGIISNTFGYNYGGASFSFFEVEGDDIVSGGYNVPAEEIRGSAHLAPEMTQVVIISPGNCSMNITAKVVIIEGGELIGQ